MAVKGQIQFRRSCVEEIDDLGEVMKTQTSAISMPSKDWNKDK